PWDSRYWIFSQEGTYLRSWGRGGHNDGQLDLLSHDPIPGGTGAIAFAPDGSFYVADEGNYRVQKFDPSGTFQLTWGTFGQGNGQFVDPKAIFVHDDVVIVGDDARDDVQEFDSGGHYIRTLGIHPIDPLLTIDGSGNIYYANASSNVYE